MLTRLTIGMATFTIIVAGVLGAQTGQWELATDTPGWSGRSEHATVAFDNKLWVLGGFDGALRNDIWSSPDGVTWTEHTPVNATNPNDPIWPGRAGHAAVVFDGKLWIMGGNTDAGLDLRNDVWSSPDGIAWTPHPPLADIWSERIGMAATVFDPDGSGERIWVLGGYDGSNILNDIWSSPDGETWTEHTPVNATNPGDPIWPKAEAHTAVSFDGKLWILMTDWVVTGYSEVWSSPDGIQWTKELGGSSLPFYGHTSLVPRNAIWVMGGLDPLGAPSDKVWRSSDGIYWEEIPQGAWEARFFHGSAALDDKLWVMGGTDWGLNPSFRDVWFFTDPSPTITSVPPATAIAGAPWTYEIIAEGNPSPDIDVSGLPNWLQRIGDTLTGTPGESDIGLTGEITIVATNTLGDDTQIFQIDVQGMPPEMTSAPNATATARTPYAYTAAATGIPAPTFEAGPLPGWLTFEASTGLLSGTPPGSAANTTVDVEITASNGWGTPAMQAFTIDIGDSIGVGGSGGGGGGCVSSGLGGGKGSWVGLIFGLALALRRRADRSRARP